MKAVLPSACRNLDWSVDRFCWLKLTQDYSNECISTCPMFYHQSLTTWHCVTSLHCQRIRNAKPSRKHSPLWTVCKIVQVIYVLYTQKKFSKQKNFAAHKDLICLNSRKYKKATGNFKHKFHQLVIFLQTPQNSYTINHCLHFLKIRKLR